MKKFPVTFEDSKLVAGYDGNEDGQNSVSLKLNLKEGLSELISKGVAKIDVKTLTLKKDGSKISLYVDTDKDGEAILEGELDVGEALDEAL